MRARFVYFSLFSLLAILLVGIVSSVSARAGLYKYYLLNPGLYDAPLGVFSLADGNEIVAGANTKTLNRFQTDQFQPADIAGITTITGSGPFVLTGSNDATDLPVPEQFLGTEFVVPNVRDEHTYYLYSPYRDTSVAVSVNGLSTQNITLTQGVVVAHEIGAINDQAAVISSANPIAVAHVGRIGQGSWKDAFPVPPAAKEVWGVYSNDVVVATTAATTVWVYSSDSNQAPVSFSLSAGAQQSLTGLGVVGAGLQGFGVGIRLVADQAIAAVQINDGDGEDASAFLGTGYLATQYGLAADSDYIAVVCPAQPTTVTLFENGLASQTQMCDANGMQPGKVVFGGSGAIIAAGSYVMADQPFFAMTDNYVSGDEQNNLGHIERYFLLNSRITSAALPIMSLMDGNTIQTGDWQITLGKYASATIPAANLAAGASIWADGPFTLASEVDGVDLAIPERFAGTEFVVPHLRDYHIYQMLSPYGDATVDIKAGRKTKQISLPQGQLVSYQTAASKKIAAVIKSTRPILISHLAGRLGKAKNDAFPIIPSAFEIFGIQTGSVGVGIQENNTNVTVYASDGTSNVYSNLSANSYLSVDVGTNADFGQGAALRIVADKPIMATHIDDGNGADGAIFFRKDDLATHYGFPVDIDYLAIACIDPNVDITLFDASGAEVAQTVCSGDGQFPGKSMFSAGSPVLVAGGYLEASAPVYVMVDGFSNNNELNNLGYRLVEAPTPEPPPNTPELVVTEEQTRNVNYTLSGSTVANGKIKIYVDSLWLKDITADTSGQFYTDITLREGDQEIAATAVNADGLESTPAIAHVQYIPNNRYEAYIVNPMTLAGDLTLISLVDNNQVFVASQSWLLQKGQQVVVPANELKLGLVIWASGMFTAASEIDGTDLLPSKEFLGTKFIIPHYRNQHTYHMYSPVGDALVQISGEVAPLSVPENQVVTFDAGSINSVARTLSSNVPIIVLHTSSVGSTPTDAYFAVPASNSIWGVRSNNTAVGALENGTVITVYGDDGSITSFPPLAAGEYVALTAPYAAPNGDGAAVHIVSSDPSKPIAAIQVDDGDGLDATAFWPTQMLSSYHILPSDAQHLTVVCPYAYTQVTITSTATSTAVCNGDSSHPAKQYFDIATNSLDKLTTIESTQPVYIIYDARSTADERNLIGLPYEVSINPPQIDELVATSVQSSLNVTGSSDSVGLQVRAYVNGLLQASGEVAIDGSINIDVPLIEGLNQIHLTLWDIQSQQESIPSNRVETTHVVPQTQVIAHNAHITGTEVWSPNYIYILDGDVFIDVGAHLTIEPGVEVRANTGSDIFVNGTLVAIGSDQQPVVFTSNKTTKSYSDWTGIRVYAGGQLQLSHAVVEYAYRAVNLTGEASLFANNTIRYSYVGLQINDGSPLVQGNLIHDNTTGVYLPYATTSTFRENRIFQNTIGIDINPDFRSNRQANPVINYNYFYDNVQYNIQTFWFALPLLAEIDARWNYWGSTAIIDIERSIYHYSDSIRGAAIDFSIFLDDSGEVVPGNYLVGVLDDGLQVNAGQPYYAIGNLVVRANTTVTFSPGSKIIFDDKWRLTVEGILNVGAQDDLPVVLTTGKQLKSDQSWWGVTITDAGLLNAYNMKVFYAQEAIKFTGGGGHFTAGEVGYSYYGISIKNASPTVGQSYLHDNRIAIEIRQDSFAQIGNGNEIVHNDYGVYFVDNNNAVPIIAQNKIYRNRIFNIQAGMFPIAEGVSINAKNNYWGTLGTAQIENKMVHSVDDARRSNIDYSGFLNEDMTPAAHDVVWGEIADGTVFQGGRTYHVTEPLTIPAGSTVTIQAGAVVKFSRFSDWLTKILVEGHLVIQGTAQLPVIMQGDLEESAYWEGIVVGATGTFTAEYLHLSGAITGIHFNSGTGTIRNSVIDGVEADIVPDNIGIRIEDSAPLLEGNTITRWNDAIVVQGNAAPAIQNGNEIFDNNNGILIEGDLGQTTPRIDPNPTINNNKFYSNRYTSTFNNITAKNFVTPMMTVIDATNNWWGSNVYDEVRETIIHHPDNATAPIVNYAPFQDEEGRLQAEDILLVVQGDKMLPAGQYVVTEDLYITNTAHLTIAADSIVSVSPGVTIHIENGGQFTVMGSAESPVRFTNAKKTLNKGTSFRGTHWNGIRVGAGGIINFDNVIVENSSIGIDFDAGGGAVTNSYFHQNRVAVFFRNGSTASLERNIIRNNSLNIEIESGAAPTIRYNTLKDRLQIHADAGASVIRYNNFESNLHFDPVVQIYRDPATFAPGHETPGVYEIIDVRENWWGTVHPGKIADRMGDANTRVTNTNAGSSYFDYSNYLDAPFGTPTPGNYLLGNLATRVTPLVAGETYIVLGDLIVPENEVLTIPAGVQLYFTQRDYYLKVKGTLNIQGTAEAPVYIGPVPWANPEYDFNQWGGILGEPGCVLNIDHVEIEDVYVAVKSDQCTLSIQNSVIQRIRSMAMDVDQTQNVLINNNLITGSRTNSAMTIWNSSGVITNNTIRLDADYGFNPGDGIRITDSVLEITNNTISNTAAAISIGGATELINFHNNDFQSYFTLIPAEYGTSVTSNDIVISQSFVNYGVYPIDATNNWWGDDGVEITGSVEIKTNQSAYIITDNTLTSAANGPSVKYFDLSNTYFSPTGNSVAKTVRFTAEWESSTSWTLRIKGVPNGDVVVTGTGNLVDYTWDGTDNAGAVVPEATYQVELSAMQGAVVAGPYLARVSVDRANPQAVISSPLMGTVLSSMDELVIKGQVEDALIDHYRVEYALQTDPDNWQSLEVTGQKSSSTEGVLAVWKLGSTQADYAVPNGDYFVRLTAQDQSGNTTQTQMTVQINNLAFSNVSVDSRIFNPVLGEQVNVQFTLNRAATVTLRVLPERGGDAVYQSSVPFAAGTHSLPWDGTDGVGKYLPDEAYIYELVANDGAVQTLYKLPFAPPVEIGVNTWGTVVDDIEYNAYANEAWKVKMRMEIPVRLTMRLTPGISHSDESRSKSINPIFEVPYPQGEHWFSWDGRYSNGEIAPPGHLTYRFEIANLADNYIIVKGTKPSILGTQQPELIDGVPNFEVKAEPYLIFHSYDQASEIAYQINQDATVSIVLLPPDVYDINHPDALTILDAQQQQSHDVNGQPILHSYTWKGFTDTDGNDIVSHAQGSFTFVIKAVSSITGFESIYRGNLQIFR